MNKNNYVRELSWLWIDAAEPDGDLSRSLNLIPYSPVNLQRTQRRRPVLFSPAALAKIIIQKILNMGGAMDFNICKPGEWVTGVEQAQCKAYQFRGIFFVFILHMMHIEH